MALQALIWDVDGTLAETERDGHLPAFNQAFAESGPPFDRWIWDDATYAPLLRITGGKERIAHWWQHVDAAGAQRADAADRIAALHALKTRHYGQRVASGAIRLRPGVASLIHEARAAGVRLAIATTTHADNVHALLQHTLGPQAPGWFEVIGAGDVVTRKKPAPDIYRWVLERLDLAASEALAIEDSSVGATAAQAVGLRVLVARSAYTAEDQIEGVLPVESLADSRASLAALTAWFAAPDR